jgi:hypothetical protein
MIGLPALYTFAVAVLAAGLQLVGWLQMRPLLSALPPTNERITFGERGPMNCLGNSTVASTGLGAVWTVAAALVAIYYLYSESSNFILSVR